MTLKEFNQAFGVDETTKQTVDVFTKALLEKEQRRIEWLLTLDQNRTDVQAELKKSAKKIKGYTK